MAAIRMTHPQHGATHAYDTGEVNKLKGWGWSVEEEKKPAAVTVTASPVVPAVVETVTTPEKKKPGRPKK